MGVYIYIIRITRLLENAWMLVGLTKEIWVYAVQNNIRTKAGRPARTYIQQLCEDTGCSPEDLPKAMNDREEWRERVRDIRAGDTT